MKNRVIVNVYVDAGCKISDGEYRILITSILCPLDIDPGTGNNDIDLIIEAVNEHLCESDENGDEFCIVIELAEDGEWEDVFYNKWFKIVSTEKHEYRENPR